LSAGDSSLTLIIPNMPWNRTRELRERIARFDSWIASSKCRRLEMQMRRSGASDHVMVELDERLAVLARTVAALERSRELAVDDLNREESLRRAISPRILVIDDNEDGRFYLAKILLSTFPHAEVIECENSEAALHELTGGLNALVLVHRAIDASGLRLVERLRSANGTIPIVYVSSIDRSHAALAVGATTFLLFDDELIGQTVREILFGTRR
jgi:CheY-like chemotaxis protein